jgi:ribonuclease HII
MLLGIDEVGRGPWAGPLVVGAVVLGEHEIEGLTDSKKLTAKRRVALDLLIREHALSYGLGWVDADELDRIGLAAALRVATIRAVEQISVPYHEIIIDGTINFLSETSKGKYVTTLPKADLLVPSVSAASIIAKVARDTYMAEQDSVYPGYNFASHVGYGTAAHRQAIDLLGVTPLHRRSFAPIAKIVSSTSSTAVGNTAEMVVADALASQGWVLLERNWKTKFCEIDIVASKDDRIAFVEVKHRHTAQTGGGLAAITPKKLQQMRFAVDMYMAKNTQYAHLQPILMAASTSGMSPKIDALLEIE